MSEAYPFHPDTSGTHPESSTAPAAPPAQTMAEAFASMPTAVRVMPDGTHMLINPEVYAEYEANLNGASIESIEEEQREFTITTRQIDGHAALCAVAADGSIIYSRGVGNALSPELYDLVYDEASRIVNEQRK